MYERKLQRLAGYDYNRSGYYYITTRVKESEHPLGLIQNNKIILSNLGKIVNQQWLWLSKQYHYVYLDEYIIMPDHFHGILQLVDTRVGNGRDRSCLNAEIDSGNGHDRSLQQKEIKSLSQIIGAFKTTSSKYIHQMGYWDFKWQKSFYDRIIRKCELNTKRNYIRNNPINYHGPELSMNN